MRSIANRLTRYVPSNVAAIVALVMAFSAGSIWGQAPGGNATPGAPVNASPSGNVSANATPQNVTPSNATPDKPEDEDDTPAEAKPSWLVVNFKGVAEGLQHLNWQFVALVGLVALWKPLRQLITSLKDAVPNRNIVLEISAFKLQLNERLSDGLDQGRQVFTRTPFELDEEVAHDGWPLVQDIKQQLTFSVSDSVATYWGRVDMVAAGKVQEMRAKLDTLTTALNSSPDAPPATVLAYAKSLEASRFREADKFATLIGRHKGLQKFLTNLKPVDGTSDDHRLILLAAGVAFSQADRWPEALATLNRIVWDANNQPLYLPAGAFWLAASYNSTLDNAAAQSVESPDFLTKIQVEIDRAVLLANAIEQKTDWHTPNVSLPHAYYIREVLKDLGLIQSLVADHLPLQHRKRLLDAARPYLERCAQTIDTEPPSPLDQNNLGDFYRQLGELVARGDEGWLAARSMFRMAHAEIDAALQKEPHDPAYINTHGLLLTAEKRYADAINTLSAYTAADAMGAGKGDRRQHVDNQLLIAKLEVAAHAADDPRGVAFALKTLESLDKFLDGADLDRDDRNNLRVQVAELLAFAYLMLPRGEMLAIAAFDRLITLEGWSPTSTTLLRTRVGHATARIRAAREQRRAGAPAQALTLRNQANRDVTQGRDQLKVLSTTESDGELRRRNIRSWMDLIGVSLLVAEEHFAARDLADAEALLKVIGEDLATVSTGAAGDPFTARYRRLTARHSLLTARLLIGHDPMLKSAETLTKAEELLRAVKGTRGDVECLAELEGGWLRLTSARLQKGDPDVDFIEAASAFERAVGLDVPAFRRAAAQALATAYAMRASLPRKKATEPASP